MDMNQYLEIFIEESKEHLQSMNSSLLYLENHPEDIDTLNEIFRVAHTLKGMSATMAFNNVAHLTHEMENVLDFIRKGNMQVNVEITDILFECFDKLESYISNVEVDGIEGDDSSIELINKLQGLKSSGGNDINKNKNQNTKLNSSNNNTLGSPAVEFNEYVNNVVSTAIKDGLNVSLIKITLDEQCMLKSARAYIIMSTLEKFCDIVHSSPSIEEIEDEKFDLSFDLVVITKHEEAFLKEELNSISEIQHIEVIPLKPQNIEVSKANTIVEDKIISVNDTDNTSTKKEAVANTQQENEEVKNKKSKTSKTVRVDIDRLDNLMNLVSELIIIKTRLEDNGIDERSQNTSEAIEYLERITTNLHDAVMKVRMVPIERVFNRFPRMVRDLSKDLGKDITLIMSGEETEVDRTVIDEIGDPLIHLIRNSIDHGIEEIEKRLELGKSKTGIVKLSAYPDGNSVVIEVQDDGSGINIEKVRNKAIERGVVTEQDTKLMANEEIIQLLFSPGFSTADEITDISGRGVGLDVVKTKIESLGGVVEADTTLGKGTKFTIRLPLTLAIIQALLVVVGSEKYAIPLNSIKEITTIQKSSIRKVQKNEVVLYRDATLPILRLSELLNVPNTIEDNTEDEEDITIVIVKKGDKDAGLIVDKLIGQQEIVIKSLGKYLSTIKSIAGATILGNGSVALIIDTNSFF